jgi:hypothetical protein
VKHSASLWRRVLPVAVTGLAAALLAPQAALATPAQPVAQRQQTSVAQLLDRLARQPLDAVLPADIPADEAALDRMLAQDLADYDEDAEVRAGAQAALDTDDPELIRDFLDNGMPVLRAAADRRKKLRANENKALVAQWAETGGPIVRQRAAAALATKNDNKIADFVAIGKAAAEAADNQETVNAANQAKTIRARVEQLSTQGGYEVRAGAFVALDSEDPAVIAAFYNTGYHLAAKRDTDAQTAIETALAARTKAVADLVALANRATRAATAQKQIIAASVAATHALTVTSNSMGLVNKYAKQGDAIYAADLPIRRAGGQTHTADLTKLRADACAEYTTTSRNADQVVAQAGVAATAAQTLIDTGLSNGIAWAEVTQAQAGAGIAAKQAAETACHAAEATEAAAKTLDADRNATVEANNAVKYRQAAEQEAAAAERLANYAEKLAAAAQEAEQDARKQRLIAEQKAEDAWAHAEQAEDHYYNARAQRDAARRWTAIAVQQQLIARDAATRAVAQQDIAKGKYENGKKLYDQAAVERDKFTTKALQAKDILKRAQGSYQRAKSKELEAQAAEARKLAMEINCKYPDRPGGTGCPGPAEEAEIRRLAAQLGTEATAARGAADQAQAESETAAAAVAVAANAARQAAAAASAAAAEARAAASEARKAHQDATAAADAANNAIEDAQKANALAYESVNVARAAMNRAVNAKANAELTGRSAEESTRQAALASFQARVTGRAALDARVAAAGIADPAGRAIDVAAAYAATDNDAAMAIDIATDAMIIGDEQSASAQQHAQDAAAAAAHATEQAGKAEAQVKPAFVAAQKAAAAAERALKASKVAIDAAKGATKEAKLATAAARDAAEADAKASWYAQAADQMASEARADATTARQAYNSARSYSGLAKKAADNAGKFATTTENMTSSALEMADTIHKISLDIGRLPRNLQDAMWEVYNAEQQARETEFARWLKTQGDKAAAKLPWGGDIAKGAVESFVGNVQSMWTLASCVTGANNPAGDMYTVPGVSVWPNSENACDDIIHSTIHMFDNPGDLIHWDMWQENWQKALGMNLVDYGSLLIPGAGLAAKLIRSGDLKNLSKFLKDDISAASLLYGGQKIADAVKKLGTINMGRLIDLKINTNIKFDFDPDEIDDFIKAVDIHGIDAVESKLRDLIDLPAAAKLKDLLAGCITGNSFAPETPVLLAGGTATKPISEIRVGDLVRATDPVTGLTSDQPVTAVHVNQDTELADVTIVDAELEHATISTTQHHRFWNETVRDWTDAIDLRPGDSLRTETGTPAYVTDVRPYPGNRTMYDLSVATVHTYYVVTGAEPVLVHNKSKEIYCDTSTLKGDEPGTALRLLAAKEYNGGKLRGFADTNAPDFIDEKNRTYDAVGGPTAWANPKMSLEEMVFSIHRHIYIKSGFDYTVLDLTGATSHQIDVVFEALDKWRADPKKKPLNKLIILGEDY